MKTVYIIEYDNGEYYEGHISWAEDKCFETEEDAANFLISKGYYKDGSRFLSFRNYKNTWYEENAYAIIKPCYLQKPVKSKMKDFSIEDYTDLPIKSVHNIYNEHVVVIEGTEDVEMEEIKLLSNSNENKLKELNKIFKCIKNIKKRKSIPDYVGFEFVIKLDDELDRFELYATAYIQHNGSYNLLQQDVAESMFRATKTYKNLKYRRGNINNDILNGMIDKAPIRHEKKVK